jgi:signal transduction histidine kinase
VIHANVYLINHAVEPEDYQRRLDAITAATEQMEHLANVLTSVAHLEDGRQSHFEVLNANELLRGIADHFSARAEERGIDLYVALEQNVPDIIGSDHELLRALGNLMRNAIRHTPFGGAITIMSRHEQGGVKMVIEDTGEGIHPNALPHIFERFYQAEGARKNHEEGSGLGLSIVKKIVEMHAGTIKVHSVPGQGSNFGIWLPSASE